MVSRALSPLRALPVLFALFFNLILGPLATVAPVAAADGIDNYSQCQIGNPSSGLDCESWINGILNATHNNYSEDEVVPQRLIIDFDDTDNHSVTLSYMTRKDSGTQNHAYDYLATWNHTYVNADRCQSLGNPALCVGGTADVHPIPSDGASVSPGGPQPTSAHELPQANRQFVMYGGDITGTSGITHTVDPAEPGSDYGNITINFDVTDSNGRVMLLFGGHLAAGFGPRGWGGGLGAASISGGPYHIRVTAMDLASIGNRDNQIMSNAIQPVPGLGIAKTTSTPVINAGQTASYTVTVTNSGQGDATGVVITDTLPAGVTWVESPDNASCTISSNVNLSCGPLTIAANSSFSVTVTGMTDAGECPSISNTASFTSTNGGSGNTTATPTVITVNCPSLDIDKTPDGGDVQAGGTASFTIVVSNAGPGTAAGVELDDDLPAVANGWAIDSENWAGDCTITGSAAAVQNLSCGPEDLGVTSRTVTVSTTTTADDCGALPNLATADGTNTDPVSDPGDISVLCADIDLDKTPDDAQVQAGDSASFTIITSNNGDGVAADATMTDDLPAVANGWTVDTEDWAGDCTITGVAGAIQSLTCGPEDIEAGGDRTVTVTADVTTDDCGLLDNLAEVSTSNDGSASDTGDITVLCPDVDVDKTPDGADVQAGDLASFTVVTSNGGDGVAAGATLTDDLPAVESGWAVDSEDWAGNCTITGAAGAVQTLTCGPEDIEAGGDRSVTVSTTTTPNDCGLLDNLADVAIDNGDGDSDAGDITVLCPDVVVDKSATDEEITGGELAEFTIVTSNDGEGIANDAAVTDDLPAVTNGWTVSTEDWVGDCSITGDAGSVQTLTCGPEDIEAGGDRSVTVSTTTTQDDCGLLDNLAEASASNEDDGDLENNADDASILVECPGLNIVKTADDGGVVAGEEASFTVTVWNAGPGEAFDVTVHDDLPTGLNWTVDLQDPDGDDFCGVASSATPGGEVSMSFDCSFGTLPVTDMAGGKVIVVSAETDRTDCGLLPNLATADASNGDEVSSGDEITVRCPELVIDKVADTELITITGPAGDLVATPSIVTWALTYTLTDGPVTNAVITDEIPVGFEFLDATNGGTLVDGVVTWTFPTLSESGSVTFRTTVDPETISRVAPTVNVAVIDSDETPEDEGQDDVRVTVEAPPLGGNPTPRPSLPDTATGNGSNGEPITVPIELLAFFFIGSLGALTLANVKARSSRR
jgi:uncharacterized repeat protein (TIGR01451 family)